MWLLHGGFNFQVPSAACARQAIRSEGGLTLSIDFLRVSCRTCRTFVELVVELVVNYVELVELVHFEELVSLLNLLI